MARKSKDVILIITRKYNHKDFDEIIELHFSGLNQYGANVGIGPWDNDLKSIEETYLNNDGDFIVCTIDERVIGMGALKKHTDEIAEIKRMRVRKEFQGRGIGTMILRKLEESATEKGYKKLVLDTTIKQVPAQRLYLRNGFVEFRRSEVMELETIFYEKELP